MIKSMKIRLLPTEEQRILMFKTAGCSRFINFYKLYATVFIYGST